MAFFLGASSPVVADVVLAVVEVGARIEITDASIWGQIVSILLHTTVASVKQAEDQETRTHSLH